MSRFEEEQRARGLVPVVRGIRVESPRVKLEAAAFVLDLDHLAIAVKGFDIIGAKNLPREGGFILASIHTTALQTLMVPAAVMEVTGRSITMVAGHTKVYPRQSEDPRILQQTGEKPYPDKSLLGKIGADLRGYILRSVGSLPVHRAGSLAELRTELKAVEDLLEAGQIVGMFLNMSRNVPEIHQGAGWIAARGRPRRIPVVPIFTDGNLWDLSPFYAAVGEPRYYGDQQSTQKDRSGIRAFTDLLHKDIQNLQALVAAR